MKKFIEKYKVPILIVSFVLIMFIIFLRPIVEIGRAGYYNQQMGEFTPEEKQEYFAKGESILENGKIEVYDVKNLRKEENYPYKGNSYKKYYVFDYVDKEGKTASTSICEDYYGQIIIGDSNKYIVEYNDMYTYFYLQLTQETYNELEENVITKEEPSVR